jgi:hypothetical protein
MNNEASSSIDSIIAYEMGELNDQEVEGNVSLAVLEL